MTGVEYFFWIFLVVIAMTALSLKNLYSSVFLLGGFSLVMSLIWVWLNAVDVAFTEAAVGAGVSSLLFFSALYRTTNVDPKKYRPGKTYLLSLLFLLVMLGLGATGIPDFGDPMAPMHIHVAPRYIEKSFEEAGVPNMVTAILAYYRGYDTLGETTVVFTAMTSVLLLLRMKRRKDER